ncbi:MAG TPA: Hsp70 family protein [Pyrinomonadaceae bacterium]|nr:Hsp70 family protein [Pyrinomonadaceae bacterium]
MSKIIGIDFGTTKTIAALMQGGSPTIIADRRGRASIPSLVLVTPESEKTLFAGWEAKEHSKRYHLDHLTISSVKRSLGKGQRQRWAWLEEHPEAVAGLILARVKLEVEHQLGEPVGKAVIAIPANYSINQRWAVRQAAELAGLEVLRLINEATAAAFTYNVFHSRGDKTLLIFDLGGGTLDVSVVEVGQGICEVKATAGDGQLGGDDFDRLLMDYVARAAFGEGEEFDSLELFRQLVLREAVTRAKIELSSASSAQIYLPGFIQDGAGRRRNLDITIERAKFDELSQDLLKRAEGVIQQALKDAGVDGPKLDAALVIGGGSRIPAVRELVSRVVGKEPFVGLDPETCVAQGAAIQAGVLSGTKTDALLLDVTPLSLSVETEGGVATVLIPRNTTIQTRKSEIFTTAKDNQTEIRVNVFEGERPLVQNNILLGSLHLRGIAPAPRGTAQIEVTFDIDVNNLLTVRAKDIQTGREVSAAFNSPARLTPQEAAGIKRFTAETISKIAVRLSWEEEKERLENLRRTVSNWKQEVEGLIEARRESLTDEQAAMLDSGLRLLLDFSERGASEEELERIYAGLKQQICSFGEGSVQSL